MRVLNYRFIDPAAEIIETLHQSYGDQLAVKHQSWHVHISPSGLLLWGDGDHVRLVYDFVVGQAVLEGAQGSEIALSIIERGNMDECSVWCSHWRINMDLLENPGLRSFDTAQSQPCQKALADMVVCQQIVEMHGGHMWIEAAPDSWAKVIFVLPKRSAELA
jgi:signal transduction histidine kinase